jgi:hypothetical protein
LAPGGGHGTIPSSPAPAAVSLIETGSTLLYPLFGAWASAYTTSSSPAPPLRPRQPVLAPE